MVTFGTSEKSPVIFRSDRLSIHCIRNRKDLKFLCPEGQKYACSHGKNRTTCTSKNSKDIHLCKLQYGYILLSSKKNINKIKSLPFSTSFLIDYLMH